MKIKQPHYLQKNRNDLGKELLNGIAGAVLGELRHHFDCSQVDGVFIGLDDWQQDLHCSVCSDESCQQHGTFLCSSRYLRYTHKLNVQSRSNIVSIGPTLWQVWECEPLLKIWAKSGFQGQKPR